MSYGQSAFSMMEMGAQVPIEHILICIKEMAVVSVMLDPDKM